MIRTLTDAVRPVSQEAYDQALQRQQLLAKPPGSLGRLEELSARLAAIADRCPPPVPERPALLVAAADHGVHARGVSMWPQELSTAVAAGCADGTAVAAVLGRRWDVRLLLLDVGLVTPVPDGPRVRRRPVVRGTRDLLVEDAMTGDEVVAALQAGAAAAAELLDDGADLLLLGDVGIANTTAAACLTGALTGAGAEVVTGRGAGADEEGLQRKVDVVRGALDRLDRDDPLAALAAVGGAEHAALVGATLRAAAAGVPVLLDGVSTTAAALVAVALCPDVRGYLLASHRSAEPAASVALDALGLDPLLDLGLRLGEGSGALLALPLVQSAAAVLRDTGLISDL